MNLLKIDTFVEIMICLEEEASVFCIHSLVRVNQYTCILIK